MTDLTAQEILDSIQRGMQETWRRLKEDRTFPRDGRFRPLQPMDGGTEQAPHARRPE